MKQLKAKDEFYGYPDGKTEKHYAAGEEFSAAEKYADMLLEKGLVSEIEAPAPAPAAKSSASKGDA